MGKGPTISLTRTAGLALVAIAWAVLLSATGSPEALLFTVPVFLIAAPLALGRYPGEELIARVAARMRQVRRAAPRMAMPAGEPRFTRLWDSLLLPGRGPPAPVG